MRIIAGLYKGRKLQRPPERSTRPTADRMRETIFNILSVILDRAGISFNDLDVLDVFAGSGALGFEALSRGAKSVTFIEQDRQVCEIISQNSHHLKADGKVILLHGNALHPMAALKSYQLVFFDPPYEQGLIAPAFKALQNKGWLAKGSFLVMELAAAELHPNLEGVEVLTERVSGHSKVIIAKWVF